MFSVEFCFEEDAPVTTAALEGENLLRVAKRNGVALWAPCGGEGSCGKCRVRILSGTLNSPPSFYIPEDEYREGWRLACLSRVDGDVKVYIGD